MATEKFLKLKLPQRVNSVALVSLLLVEGGGTRPPAGKEVEFSLLSCAASE